MDREIVERPQRISDAHTQATEKQQGKDKNIGRDENATLATELLVIVIVIVVVVVVVVIHTYTYNPPLTLATTGT